MKLTDEMIAKAAKDYEQSTLDSLSFTEHAFSPAFERRMKRLIRRQELSMGYVYFRRAVCAILAIVLCVGAFLMLHTEARAAVVKWLKERFDSLTYYYSSGEGKLTTDPTDAISTSYDLGWLPEGYSFYTRVDQETGGSVYYQNESGYYIVLTYLYDYEDGMIAVLHETSTLKKATVNGCDADLYLEKDPNEASSLVWIGKDNRELFTVIGVCEEDVLIKIAENVISVQQ